MRKTNRAVLVAAVLAIAAAPVQGGAALAAEYDFRGGGTPFAKDGQGFEIVELDGQKAARLSWDAARKNWAECWIAGPPSWNEPKDMTIKVALRAGEKSRPASLALRLIDGEGEVFPWTKGITFDADGRATVEFAVPRNHRSKNTWVNNPAKDRKNGALDFPARLGGFAISYPKDSGEGEVYIVGVETNGEAAAPPKTAADGEGRERKPVEISFHPAHPLSLVFPETAGTPSLALRNNGRSAVEISGDIEVRDVAGDGQKKKSRCGLRPARRSA